MRGRLREINVCEEIASTRDGGRYLPGKRKTRGEVSPCGPIANAVRLTPSGPTTGAGGFTL